MEPKKINMYRCVGRYGYMDVRDQEEPFERILVENLKQFIRDDYKFSPQSQESAHDSDEDTIHGVQKEALERDIEAVDKAWEAGAVHLIGENEVVAAEGAGIGKRLMINYAFNFLKKNLRGSETVFDIPHKRMVKVGMTYEL